MPLKCSEKNIIEWKQLVIQEPELSSTTKEEGELVKNEASGGEKHVSVDGEKIEKKLDAARSDTEWEPVTSEEREPVSVQMMRLQGLDVVEEDVRQAHWVNSEWINKADEVVFEVDGLQLLASKQLLVAASPYFRALLKSGPNRIFVDNYPFEAVQEMINWIEDEKYEANPSMELLQLASIYKIEKLFDNVQHKMEHKMNLLCVNNCLDFLVTFDEFKAWTLKRFAMKFIIKNWKEVMTTSPTFIPFTKDESGLLIELLTMSTDCVNMYALNMYL